jgi:hypothetical protein
MSDILFSIACLVVTILACLSGVFSRHYRDNWMQYLGLWAILAGALGRGWQLSLRWHYWVNNPLMPEPDISNQNLALYGGLALFAVGTAWKVWRHRGVIVKDGSLQRAELQ